MVTKTGKSRVVLITRNFPPLVGGMEKLNFHIAQELSTDYPVHVIGPTGADSFISANQKISTCPSSIGGFLICATLKVCLLALTSLGDRSKKPTTILSGSGVSAPMAWLLARLTRCRFGVYLHGLDIIAESIVYRRLFLPLIQKADFWVVNSSATRSRAIELGIPESKISVVHPGVTLPTITLSSAEISTWKQRKGIPDGPLLLSVGRLTRRKGLKEFILHSLPLIVEDHPDTKLLIVGSEPKNALLGNGVGQDALMEAGRIAGVADHLFFAGSVSDRDLMFLFNCADAHVFPIIPTRGDMEGFGMVATEAAANGLPTVAFAEGGVVDAISDGVSGFLIPPGDYPQFASSTARILSDKSLLPREKTIAFARTFAWPIFGEKIRNLII